MTPLAGLFWSKGNKLNNLRSPVENVTFKRLVAFEKMMVCRLH